MHRNFRELIKFAKVNAYECFGHSRKFKHAKTLKIGTNESLTVISLSEARAIARTITVCQMAINLKLARVCMRSLVNTFAAADEHTRFPCLANFAGLFLAD